ncbi:unnamed protein product [Arctogadus glacialis]
MPLFSGLMISLRRTSVLESADQMENTENLCSLDYCYGEPLEDTEHEAGKLEQWALVGAGGSGRELRKAPGWFDLEGTHTLCRSLAHGDLEVDP